MYNVSNFLERFSHIVQKKEYVLNVCLEVLTEQLGVTCNTKDLKLKNKTLIVQVSGAVKSQIFFSKKTLIDTINNKAGKKVVEDIR